MNMPFMLLKRARVLQQVAYPAPAFFAKPGMAPPESECHWEKHPHQMVQLLPQISEHNANGSLRFRLSFFSKEREAWSEVVNMARIIEGPKYIYCREEHNFNNIGLWEKFLDALLSLHTLQPTVLMKVCGLVKADVLLLSTHFASKG